ncbi:MAG: 2-dehydropantoate 2-reductase [Alphaproteobacteria bacterium]|nr:2-dehydropantoate 2-reductase [Alphaproteobacteria bacterium]
MRIAIMGSGGVGGFFGARLAQAGHDVVFIARGRQLEAMRTEGLRINSDLGDIHLEQPQATDDPSSIEPVEAALFSTKLYDTEDAARQLAPALGDDGFVVTIQNGVTSPDMIASVIGKDRVLGGTTYIISHLSEPGVIEHTGPFQRIHFGELDGSMSERAKRFEAACEGAGIEIKLSENVLVDMWEKYITLSTMSGMTALTRCPIGPILESEELTAMTEEAVHEVASVGRACGVPIPADAEERTIKGMKGAPMTTKSSMLVDLEHGRRLELPWFSATVAKLGKDQGIATPVHRFIAAALSPHVNGARS